MELTVGATVGVTVGVKLIPLWTILPSNLFNQLAQFFADALGLFFVSMHYGIFKQGVKSLDRLYRTCPPACPP